MSGKMASGVLRGSMRDDMTVSRKGSLPKLLASECILRFILRLYYFVWLVISGYSLESKDDLVDALPTLKQRAAEDDANILFSVASDLSKVHCLVLFWFIEQLSIDCRKNCISAFGCTSEAQVV